MDIRLGYESDGALKLSVDVGQLTITGDKALVNMAAAWMLKRRIGDDMTVEGFWDSLRAGVTAIKKLADIPIVRKVVSAIPYGGTALAAVDVASEAAKLGKKTMRKAVPKKAALLINKALKGDQAARDALNRAAAANPAVAQRIRGNVRLIRDVQRLEEFADAHRRAQEWSDRTPAMGPALLPEETPAT